MGWFSWSTNWAHGLTARFVSTDYAQDWLLFFAAPDRAPLSVGDYTEAQRFPVQQAGHPGMSIGSGCNTIAGHFNVSEVAYDSSGRFTAFHATFEQICVDTGSTIVGEIALNADVRIVMTVPDESAVQETDPLTFDVLALHVDDRPVALFAGDLPVGATFQDLGGGTGRLTWTPARGQAGKYLVDFRAEDDAGSSQSLSTLITVDRLNRPPVADAGGPYEGVVGSPVPVTFDGTGSSDPDGDRLWFAWNLGDAWTSGAAATRAYASTGTYPVTLWVGDEVFTSFDATTVTIRDPNAPDLTGDWEGLRAFCVGGERFENCILRGLFQITNLGNLHAGNSFLDWYLSADPFLDAGDTKLGEVAVGELEAGQVRQRVPTAAVPAGVRPHRSYVLVAVDATGVVAEVRELNNVVSFGPISTLSLLDSGRRSDEASTRPDPRTGR